MEANLAYRQHSLRVLITSVFDLVGFECFLHSEHSGVGGGGVGDGENAETNGKCDSLTGEKTAVHIQRVSGRNNLKMYLFVGFGYRQYPRSGCYEEC